MKVAFFIGHHKTGSTSLQNYMASNYVSLLKQGILYPAVESEGISAALAAVLAGRDAQRAFIPLSVAEPHNALAFRLLNEASKDEIPPWHTNLPDGFQMFRLIKQQILHLKPEHVVICSEVMSRFAGRSWQKIMPRMKLNFGSEDCTLVLNLRRPDIYLASWHAQQLRFGAKLRSLRDGAHRLHFNSVHFRVDLVVQRWSEAFPAARMVVRNYDDVVAAGGTTIDFFAQTGIPHVPSAEAERKNESIPYALVEIVRRVNIDAPEHARAVVEFIVDATQRVKLVSNSQIEMYGEAMRAELYATFAPIHAALSELLHVPKFFPDIEEALVCRPVPEMVAAREALSALKQDALVHAKSQPVRDFIAQLELFE